LEESEDLEFIYAHGPQFEEYKLKEKKSLMKRRKAGRRFVAIFHSLLQGMEVMLMVKNLLLELSRKWI
jgi:hypothetical protein